MNWKSAFLITLLALAASLFGNYRMLQNGAEYQAAVCPPNEAIGRIDAAEAQFRISMFSNYLDSVTVVDSVTRPGAPAVPPGGKKYISRNDIPQENRKVKFFEITDLCEFSAMLLAAHSTEQKVYAFMGVTEDEVHPDQGMIDLVFKVKSEKNDPKTTDQHGYMYYDFTHPCPPMCPPEDTTGMH